MQFTIEQFELALAGAVAERGSEWRYPRKEEDALGNWYEPMGTTCQYTTASGELGCIVGAALHKIDPELVPDYGVSMGASMLFKTKRMLEDGAHSWNEVEKFYDAVTGMQTRQDSGATWGEALDHYKAVMEGRVQY